MKRKIVRNSLLIVGTFLLGLIVNINIGPNKLKFSTQQDRAEAYACYKAYVWCYDEFWYGCLDTGFGSQLCDGGDTDVCLVDISCGS